MLNQLLLCGNDKVDAFPLEYDEKEETLQSDSILVPSFSSFFICK